MMSDLISGNKSIINATFANPDLEMFQDVNFIFIDANNSLCYVDMKNTNSCEINNEVVSNSSSSSTESSTATFSTSAGAKTPDTTTSTVSNQTGDPTDVSSLEIESPIVFKEKGPIARKICNTVGNSNIRTDSITSLQGSIHGILDSETVIETTEKHTLKSSLKKPFTSMTKKGSTRVVISEQSIQTLEERRLTRERILTREREITNSFHQTPIISASVLSRNLDWNTLTGEDCIGLDTSLRLNALKCKSRPYRPCSYAYFQSQNENPDRPIVPRNFIEAGYVDHYGRELASIFNPYILRDSTLMFLRERLTKMSNLEFEELVVPFVPLQSPPPFEKFRSTVNIESLSKRPRHISHVKPPSAPDVISPTKLANFQQKFFMYLFKVELIKEGKTANKVIG